MVNMFLAVEFLAGLFVTNVEALNMCIFRQFNQQQTFPRNLDIDLISRVS